MGTSKSRQLWVQVFFFIASLVLPGCSGCNFGASLDAVSLEEMAGAFTDDPDGDDGEDDEDDEDENEPPVNNAPTVEFFNLSGSPIVGNSITLDVASSDTFEFIVQVNDPDGDVVAFAGVTETAGTGQTSANHIDGALPNQFIVTVAPLVANVSYTFLASASDVFGLPGSASLNITTFDGTPPEDFQATVRFVTDCASGNDVSEIFISGSSASLHAIVTDPESAPIVEQMITSLEVKDSLGNLVGNATFGAPVNGCFDVSVTGLPDSAEDTFSVEIKADDLTSGLPESFASMLLKLNLDPTISVNPASVEATVGETVQATVTFSADEFGDASLSVNAGGADVTPLNSNSSPTTLSITSASVGLFNIVVTATDPQGNTASETISFNAIAENQAPCIEFLHSEDEWKSNDGDTDCTEKIHLPGDGATTADDFVVVDVAIPDDNTQILRFDVVDDRFIPVGNITVVGSTAAPSCADKSSQSSFVFHLECELTLSNAHSLPDNHEIEIRVEDTGDINGDDVLTDEDFLQIRVINTGGGGPDGPVIVPDGPYGPEEYGCPIFDDCGPMAENEPPTVPTLQGLGSPQIQLGAGGDEIVFTASSTDDGQIESFFLSVEAGSSEHLDHVELGSTATSQTYKITATKPGAYHFRIEVTDNEGASAITNVHTVTALAPDLPETRVFHNMLFPLQPPVISIHTEPDSVNPSDEIFVITSYPQLTFSPSVDLLSIAGDNPSFFWSTIEKPATISTADVNAKIDSRTDQQPTINDLTDIGTYVFEAVTTDEYALSGVYSGQDSARIKVVIIPVPDEPGPGGPTIDPGPAEDGLFDGVDF